MAARMDKAGAFWYNRATEKQRLLVLRWSRSVKRLRRAHQRHPRENWLFRRRILAAGTAAALSLGGTGIAGLPSPTHDRHQILVTPDADKDFLTDSEESAIGYQPFSADQNRNAFPDGVELAVRCLEAITRLPTTADANDPARIYKEELPQRGVERCESCGGMIEMGTLRLINPRLGLQTELPFISRHYMEHGSFNYQGGANKGRANVPLLLRVLELRFPCEPDLHQLPLDYRPAEMDPLAPDANDLDGDLLADSEELALGLNLHRADQNENLVPDGPELAQRFAEIIDRLPAFEPDSPDAKGIHKVNFMLRGIELCEICGESVNMGHWQVVNSTRGLSLDVPVIAWHYMQHGSFSFLSRVHDAGRMDMAMLRQILEFPRQCGDLGTMLLPGDMTGDCRVDFKDLSILADQWLQSPDPAGEQADHL